VADFPAIEPDGRQHSWGDAPQALSVLAGGVETRNRLAGDLALTGERLTLSYPLATFAEVELIRAHYRAQGDGLLEFGLPELVVRCDALLISRGALWRYIEPPQEDDLGNGRFAVDVQLGAVASTWVERAITWGLGIYEEELYATGIYDDTV
jgi:hypothetical protein